MHATYHTRPVPTSGTSWPISPPHVQWHLRALPLAQDRNLINKTRSPQGLQARCGRVETHGQACSKDEFFQNYSCAILLPLSRTLPECRIPKQTLLEGAHTSPGLEQRAPLSSTPEPGHLPGHWRRRAQSHLPPCPRLASSGSSCLSYSHLSDSRGLDPPKGLI